ncbi:MAG: gliding motility protein GldM [Tannerella sp.]|jgi:gliding motility-associated protein GldM|nr:gliding motility protein GldM [Tannerella sp.]
MAGIASNPNSPRQKMINLMYLVFIAMLALNVSSEVLDGFELVETSLRTSTKNSTLRNEEVKANLDRAYRANETKVSEWYEKGVQVKDRSDDLFNYINELKLRIVQAADGKNGDVENIKQKENLEAASRVMLAPVVGEGKKLRERIDSYRAGMSDMVGDPGKIAMFETILSTKTLNKGGITAPSWETALFENMPVAAAVTLLTKLQSDIRFVEGETLSQLLTNVDIGDYRVNKIDAVVIPKSQIVSSGMPFEGRIVLAAVDSTKQPEFYVGEELLAGNTFSIGTSGVGDRQMTGKVVSDGQTYTYTADYSVTEASATIAPVLMNFLYESYANDIVVAIPGVPSGAVSASLKGAGNIRQKEGNIWTVSGLDVASDNVDVVLTASIGGRSISVSKNFKVKQLPNALPFIPYKDADGRNQKFKSGAISKRFLVESPGIGAAIDDGLLDIPYTVTGFTIRMVDNRGNVVPEISNSSNFTAQQKEIIRNMPTGTRFFISEVKALDPGGKPVTIAYSLDVLVRN